MCLNNNCIVVVQKNFTNMEKKNQKNNLYWNRLKKNLTIEELAEIVGISSATISRAENGRKISFRSKERLEKFFGLTILELQRETNFQ